MLPAAARYGPCPACSALNMAHRAHCYRCRKPLPDEFWVTGGAQPAAGPLPPVPAFHRPRRYPRRRVEIGALLSEPGANAHYHVIVQDISLGGVQIRTPGAFLAKTDVRLLMPMQGRTHPIDGVIRYCRPVLYKDGRGHSCGVEFYALSPVIHRLIARL